MEASEIVTAIIIHIVIPVIGVVLYLRLLANIKKDVNTSDMTIQFGIIFMTYGGLLLVVLTSIFWYWSGMASLGVLYLILLAPLLMGVIAYKNYNKRSLSKYYSYLFNAAVLYYIIVPLTFLMIFAIST